VNVCDKCLAREPDAGNPHVRFDEGEGCHPQGWPPLYSTVASFVDCVSDKAHDKARDKGGAKKWVGYGYPSKDGAKRHRRPADKHKLKYKTNPRFATEYFRYDNSPCTLI
jgi:hypothetical protein